MLLIRHKNCTQLHIPFKSIVISPVPEFQHYPTHVLEQRHDIWGAPSISTSTCHPNRDHWQSGTQAIRGRQS
ncbi:hypothetical protein ACTXT7_007777 [Hymenolepis weldensis]